MTLKELIEKCGGSTNNAVHEWCEFRNELNRLIGEFGHQSWREGYHDKGALTEEAREKAKELFHQLFDALYN